MYYILTLLTCLMFSPLVADQMGNVEYQLPNNGQGWKMHEEYELDNIGSTRLYLPENSSPENAEEYVIVYINNVPYQNNLDKDSLETMLKEQFKNRDIQVTVNIIETSPQSAIYDWSLDGNLANEVNKLNVITRFFSNEEGSAMISYQTTNPIEDIDNTRAIWVEAFKKAKFVK